MTILLLLFVAFCPLSQSVAENTPEPLTLDSPDGRMRVTFRLGKEGRPAFRVTYRGTLAVEGALGLKLAGSAPLRDNLEVSSFGRERRDETYAIPVGKASSARDQHNELTIALEETGPPGRRLDVAFRAFDDGVAFRYVIPEQESLADFVIVDEQTELTFAARPTARALPLADHTTPYEAHYRKLPVAAVGPKMLLGLPLLLEQAAGGAESSWLAVTEANLDGYAGMYLSGVDGKPGTLVAKLSPLPGRKDGAKVIGKAPHVSPWRVLMIGEDPGRLISSHIVFHLNDPTAIEDTSWIKPGKTTFPWWNGYVVEGADFAPGVNTATMIHYIDFCAEQGIPYHSLDGLDIAWYGGPIRPRGPTDVTTAAPSIDLPEVLRHAKKKGIRLRLWTHWKALKPQIDEAFRLYEEWGIEGVMVDFMDRDDQEMVRFYHDMAEKAARHHLTLTFHGSYKPTGMERTWPNVLSSEAVLNQEYNKWDRRGTPPEHNLDVAFVRMLAGPLDYHQGGMRSVLPERYHPRDKAPPVQGTRGHQLAMYVVYQNHLPMMADYPAAYRGEAGLEFMVQVPTTWDETRVLRAEMGRCLVIARRKGSAWYAGGMTAGEAREIALRLDFLPEGSFAAELFLDDPAKGPTSLKRRRRTVSATGTLEVAMPPAGGFVARLLPARR